MATAEQVKTMRMIKQQYGDKIAKASEYLGLPKVHIYNLIYTESKGNASALGDSGDFGLTQLLPATAEEIAKELGHPYKDRADLMKQLGDRPGLNILFGAKYYKKALDLSDGDPVLAYSHYNAGHPYPTKSDFHRGVHDKISARDLTGDDQISKNAARFASNYGIMGYDPYGTGSSQRPAQANLEPLAANRDIHRDPYADTQSVFNDNITARGRVRHDPTKMANLMNARKQLMDNPVTGVPLSAVEGFGDAAMMGYGPSTESIWGEQTGTANKFGRAVGSGAGLVAGMGALGLSGPLGLGAHGFLHKGSLKERSKAGLLGTLLGGTMTIAPTLTALGLGKISEPAAKKFVKAMQKRPVRMASDVPPLTALGLLQGESLPEAVTKAAGMAVGFGASPGHGPVNREIRSLSKTPEQREAPKFVEPTVLSTMRMAREQAQTEAKHPKADMSVSAGPDFVEGTPVRPRERGMVRPEEIFTADSKGLAEKPRPKGSVGEPVKEAINKNTGTSMYRDMEKTIPAAKVGNDLIEGKITTAEYFEILSTDPTLRELPPEVKKQIESGQVSDTHPIVYALGASPTRVIQSIGKGEHFSPLEQATLRFLELQTKVEMTLFKNLGQEAVDVLNKYGISPDSKDSSTLSKVMRPEYEGLRSGESATEYMMRKRDILKEAENPEAVMNAALELRPQLDRMSDYDTMMADAYGRKRPGYQEGYLAAIERRYNPLKKGETKDFFNKFLRPQHEWSMSRKPGFISPSKKLDFTTPREQVKKGDFPKEKLEPDFWRSIGASIHSTARRGATTGPAKMFEETANALEASGKTKAAAALRAVGQSTINDKGFGLRGLEQQLAQTTRPGMAVTQTARTVKQLFNMSKYIWNIPFMAYRQPASMANTMFYVEPSPKMIGRALLNAYNPRGEFQAIYEKTFTGMMKTHGRGRLFKEQAAGEITSSRDILPESMAKHWVQKLAEGPTGEIENGTGRFAASMASEMADAMGLKGAAKEAFISDVIQKTQSIYSGWSRSEFQRSPIFNMRFPAQSYPSDTFQSIIETSVPGFGLKLYKTQAQINAANNRAIGAIFLANMVYTYANSYRQIAGQDTNVLSLMAENAGTTAQSLVPYAPNMLGIGPSRGKEYQGQLAQEVARAAGYAWNGDWPRAFEAIANEVIPAGGNISKGLSADRMIKEGKIPGDFRTRFGASALGWWQTPEGKQYRRQLNKYGIDDGKGWFGIRQAVRNREKEDNQ